MKCPKCESDEAIGRGRNIWCKSCKRYSSKKRVLTGEPIKGKTPCPVCGSSDTKKNGHNLYCKTCKRYSVPDSQGGESQEVEYGEGYIRVISSSPRIKSVEDVISAFKINPAEWRVDKVRAKTSEGYRKDKTVDWSMKNGIVLEGKVHDTGKMLVVPMYHMEVLFSRRTHEIRARAAIEEMIREAKQRVPHVSLKSRPPKDGLLFEVDFPDLHFGKLTWEEESGANYDVKIASNIVQRAVESLAGYTQGRKIKRVLLPLGNDFFNVDNKDNTTTRGTPQQEDTRWQKTFRMGRRLAVQIIEGLTQIAPVDVLIIPGNHDEQRMFYLGDVLDVKYENDKRVWVDNNAMKRKYYTFGKVLLGLTHGYHEKYDKLSFIMSTEKPEEWGKASHKEWHLGDKHHKQDMLYGAEDLNGVTIRLLRSLSATDAWHFDKGFVGQPRGAEAFLWHPDDGLVAQFHTTVKRGEE